MLITLPELRSGTGFLVGGGLEIRVSLAFVFFRPTPLPWYPRCVASLTLCTDPQAEVNLLRLKGAYPELETLTADGDVLLQCAGDVIVRAHRLILSLSSSLLKDMLANSPAAAQSGPVELPCEMDCPALWRKALTFLYPLSSSDRQLSWEILGPLMRLADKCDKR